MKIAHISDLHLGITLNGFSLKEDQEYILNEIVKICVQKKIDVLLVAGDVHDKNIATIDGLNILGDFIKKLNESHIKVMVISGNHDSAERLTFGTRFMETNGIYFSKVYDGNIEPIVLEDEYGKINFYLLPFITPNKVRTFNPESRINTYDDALRCAVENMKINEKARNIIVTHQNIQNAQLCESEEHPIGNLDAISKDVFMQFDYTALGHIHTPQAISDTIIYCGSPLKYSASEIKKDKSVPIVELKEKGNIKIDYEKLVPLKDMRKIKGRFAEILEQARSDSGRNDYIYVELTDDEEILDAITTLRGFYENIVHLEYNNKSTNNNFSLEDLGDSNINRPLEMVEDFFKNRSNCEMTEEQRTFITEMINRTWGEN